MEENTKKYLLALSEKYPTRLSCKIRLIELNATLNLPKGTEHFMSDLHGEADAFLHIRKNASGVIKNKIKRLFEGRMNEDEMSELATVIYYPEEKLSEIGDKKSCEWFESTIYRIIEILRKVSLKYSNKDFMTRIVGNVHGFEGQISQIVWNNSPNDDYFKIITTKGTINARIAKDFIIALSEAVKILVVDRLHVVGDIFDRGPRPDIIIDELMGENLDIEWGNHDVLWMGAASGSEACIASVISTSLNYANLDVLEFGYGISLRPLAAFAQEVYSKSPANHFMPRGGNLDARDKSLIAKMNKAMAVIRFKTEGKTILRNPDFKMDDRLILQSFNKKLGTVRIQDKEFSLIDKDLPTVDEAAPYELCDGELAIMEYYKTAFTESQRLREHIAFLFRSGSLYRIYNGNLLFHGCVPLDENGELMKLSAAGGRCGKELFDYCDRVCRDGFFGKPGSEKKQIGEDLMWFLGCGRNSPLLGRDKMAVFERFLLSDEEIKKEPKNAYYRAWEDEKIVKMILSEFGLRKDGAHIINGHIPQHRGENPVKAGGRLIVIDGGFCSAYHKTTGIAGYTLIYNAEGMRLSAHAPFNGKEDAIKNNGDILSETVIFETKREQIRVRETDLGREIREEMCDLAMLLEEYKTGRISERL